MSSANSKGIHAYRQMLRIRRFEESVLDAFPSGLFYGTTHTYLGQEANAVGVLAHLNKGDIVFSNHRCHGHFLAYGGDMRALFAELMGKASGVSGGRGGSQHIHWNNFYSNGVLGSTAPVATGAALAEKIQGKPNVVVIFIGDGTLGQGVVYESLNIAALWKAPILFVLENNHIAQTTPAEIAIAGKIADRFTAFGIHTTEMDSSNVAEIRQASQVLFASIRKGSGPHALLLNTYRFGPHSKGDDTRDEKDLALIRAKRDPILIAEKELSKGSVAEIRKEVEAEVLAAFEQAKTDPEPAS